MMFKVFLSLTILFFSFLLSDVSVQAQNSGNRRAPSISYAQAKPRQFGGYALSAVPNAGYGRMVAQVDAGVGGYVNGLPPTRTDSFVKEAKGHATHIYGDEGVNGPPPYMGFSRVHRINTGIMDDRDKGLTTGHGSYLPEAWGADEYTGNEWSQSGSTGATSASGFTYGEPNTIGGQNGSNLPPAPGPGYQPAYTCEGFVGWYSPEEVALAQTDFPAAFDAFVHSDRYTGSRLNADLILRLQMGRGGY
jgi:hypothetical protein